MLFNSYPGDLFVTGRGRVTVQFRLIPPSVNYLGSQPPFVGPMDPYSVLDAALFGKPELRSTSPSLRPEPSQLTRKLKKCAGKHKITPDASSAASSSQKSKFDAT